MGEVYRARDPRLGRDVAVKVLPAAFSADPERLTRFEQEARAAAALNHPNILAVYDVGQLEGSPYIVSELVVRSLDVAAGLLTGDPVTVADRVSYDGSFNLGGFSVSAVGRLAYRAGGSERRQLTWFDRTGKRVGVAGESDANNLVVPALSPDSRRIAITRTVQSNQDRWVTDVQRGGATRFTFDSGQRQHRSLVAGRDAYRLPVEPQGDLRSLPQVIERRGRRRIDIDIAVYQDTRRLQNVHYRADKSDGVRPQGGVEIVELRRQSATGPIRSEYTKGLVKVGEQGRPSHSRAVPAMDEPHGLALACFDDVDPDRWFGQIVEFRHGCHAISSEHAILEGTEALFGSSIWGWDRVVGAIQVRGAATGAGTEQ